MDKSEGREELPTTDRAQWEYACRVGNENAVLPAATIRKHWQRLAMSPTRRCSRPSPTDWSFTIKASDGYVFTAPVGHFRANAFGLYDMHGNAWEFCLDWYDEDYYRTSPVDDPAGPATGSLHVVRGGIVGEQAGRREIGRAGRAGRATGTASLDFASQGPTRKAARQTRKTDPENGRGTAMGTSLVLTAS